MENTFKFNICGIKGDVNYAMCMDNTMMGTITVGNVTSKFVYNSEVDILPVINGMGNREEKLFLYSLIKDEYKRGCEKIRFEKEFHTLFHRNWIREAIKELDNKEEQFVKSYDILFYTKEDNNMYVYGELYVQDNTSYTVEGLKIVRLKDIKTIDKDYLYNNAKKVIYHSLLNKFLGDE